MAERNGHWSGLTEDEQTKILSLIKEKPALAAELVAAAQQGDTLAAEVLTMLGRVVAIDDWDNPEKTRIIPNED